MNVWGLICEELPKKLRDLIVEKYKLGEEYKRISKALDVPVKTIINTGEKVAPQRHSKDHDDPPKLMRGRGENLSRRLPTGQRQH